MPAPAKPAPTKPLKDAIAEYQAKNPYSQQAFEGLFSDLQKQGYQVARATHANNSLASDDALVDAGGNAYDLVYDAGGPAGKWQVNDAGIYDSARSVVGPDGKFVGFSDWSKANGGTGTTTLPPAGSTPAGTTQPSIVLGQGGAQAGAVNWTRMRFGAKAADHVAAGFAAAATAKPGAAGPPSASSSNPYAAAATAAAKARMTGNRGGRRSTILGGFGSGAPSTRPATVLGA